tara:strand:- start:4627 stop:4980 length:354 start_codon:yes stop_codon:yes gene_type:complete
MSISGSKRGSENKEKISTKLPWWVELLFVQIGLPDKWLPKILSRKNKTQKLIFEKRKSLLYFLILVGLFIYIDPYTKYFRSQNTCIDIQISLLKEGLNEDKVNRKMITSEAVRNCNG